MIFKLGKLDKEVAERISNGETPIGTDLYTNWGYRTGWHYWYACVLTFKFEGEDVERKVNIEIEKKDQPALDYLSLSMLMNGIDWRTGIIAY